MTDDELERVPTVHELAKRGAEWAKPHPAGGYSVTAKGQQLLTDMMRRNGRRNRERKTTR